MARNARHTIDFDFNDVSVARARFRNSEEYNNSSAGGGNPSQEEENRSDSPVIARLGPAVGGADLMDVTPLNNSQIGGGAAPGGAGASLSRRRCGKTTKDLHPNVHNQRFPLPEQPEECPSSGDEGVVSPRKRIKMDYHHHQHHSNASGVSLV